MLGAKTRESPLEVGRRADFAGTADRSMSTPAILFYAMASLLAGHLLLREYMPNPAVGGVGFIMLVMILGYVLFKRNDVFAFAMIIYICSHFSYADNQGGLWALLAGILLGVRLAFGHRVELRRKDTLLIGLLAILVLWNALGWVLRNPMPYVDRLQSAGAFLGFVLMFYFVGTLAMTHRRLRMFLLITFVLFAYQILITINQRYAVFNWNTPLIGAYSEGMGAITYKSTNAWGTLRHSELVGEYGALFWALLIPILSCSLIQREVRFSQWWIIATMFMALILIAITSTRSAALLAALAVAMYLPLLGTGAFRSVDRFGRQIQLAIVLALLIPAVGFYVGLDTLEQNFAELKGTVFTTESVASGKALNRGNLFVVAMERLMRESWFIGFGFGSARSNIWAWTGIDPSRVQSSISDFHSLYLSLPFVFGWIGSAAFVGLLVLTFWRAWRTALRYSKRRNVLVPVALGFAVFWGVLILDQFKISVLRVPSYHMLYWTWLGLSTSVVRTLTSQPALRRGASSAAPEETDADDADDEPALS